MEDVKDILKTLGVGTRPVNDPFFNNTYKQCKVFERKGVVIEDNEVYCHEEMKEPIVCPACPATFSMMLDFDFHYNTAHRFECSQCKKWCPTARLLEIHVLENHDSFFKVTATKQPMYQCFVCEEKFNDPIDRKSHCQKVHAFPKKYRYDDSTNTKQQKSNADDMAMETDQEIQRCKKNSKIQFGISSGSRVFSKSMNTNTHQKSKVTEANTTMNEKDRKAVTMFVPRQVQQRSFAKTLTNNKKRERNVLETEHFLDLHETLPDIKNT